MRVGTMPWKWPASASPDFWMREARTTRLRPLLPAATVTSMPRPSSSIILGTVIPLGAALMDRWVGCS